jgi:hypothetical protein
MKVGQKEGAQYLKIYIKRDERIIMEDKVHYKG